MKTKRDAFRFIMALKISGNCLLKVINTVFDKGIWGMRSYYDSDVHTAIL